MAGVEQVRVAPGDGVVARRGSSVLLAAATTQAHREIVGQVLDWSGSGPDGGADLVRRVGALVTGLRATDVPALGLVTRTERGLVVLLAGDVRAVVEGDTVTELCGLDALTYVERVVGAPDRVRVALPLAPHVGADGPADGASVPGSGFVLDLVPEADPVAVGDGRRREPWVESDPTLAHGLVLPEHPDVGFEPVPDEEVQVWGVRCARGHFTRPAVERCLRCGVSLDAAAEPYRGVRPVVGVLTADHGEQRELSRDVVIGREPAIAVDVLAGLAEPMTLTDPALALSRVHTRILLDGWDVRVEDASSANGTFLSEHEGEWEQLLPGVSHLLTPGSHIAVGSRTLRLDPPR